MSDSESTYKIQGSRVYGNGRSFNCTNIATARELQKLLNTYETTKKLNTNIEKQYDTITRQLIQIKLTTGTLQHEIQTLEEQIQCLSK